MLTAGTLPRLASGDSIESFVAYGTIDSAPRGYVGCVASVGPEASYDVAYCFVATTISYGSAAGQVEVVAKKIEIFNLPEIPDVVRAVVPGDALQLGGTVERPTMSFEASLPVIGSVSISMTTQAPVFRISATDGCDLHPIHSELISDERSQAAILAATGTIEGRAVEDFGRGCNIFFTNSTSGLWRMASGL